LFEANMSDSAQRRVQAISNQLKPGELPPVHRVAAKGPRVAGKVVIITGTPHK